MALDYMVLEGQVAIDRKIIDLIFIKINSLAIKDNTNYQ